MGWITRDADSLTIRLPFLGKGRSADSVAKDLSSTVTSGLATTTRFLRAYYVALIFVFVIGVFAWAYWIGLGGVPGTIPKLLDQLEANAGDAEATRSIIFALASLLAGITIFGTLVAQSIRVWINERTARTAEANLTTGLLNTAVEGLGADKKISRIGRPVRLGEDTNVQWQGDPDPFSGEAGAERGDWRTFETNAPNLEVRIGAILTLERIARENPSEHIRVMEILCAYIRENAPAADVKDHGLGTFPSNLEGLDAEGIKNLLSARHLAILACISHRTFRGGPDRLNEGPDRAAAPRQRCGQVRLRAALRRVRMLGLVGGGERFSGRLRFSGIIGRGQDGRRRRRGSSRPWRSGRVARCG